MNQDDKHADDQVLSAYLDGELPRDEADRLTGRLAAEPALARRLEDLRAADAATRQAFRAIDQLPLPQGVLDLLQTEERTRDRNDEGTGNVIPFPQRVMRSFLQAPVVIAASLALAAGFFASGQLRDAPPDFGVTGGVVQNGTNLHRLLESATSATPVPFSDEASGELLLTFEDTAGTWCRELRLTYRSDSMQGVACRRGDEWRMEVATFGRAAAPSGPYQAASGGPATAVTAVIDELIGDHAPLDLEAERRLLRSGWQKNPQRAE